MRRRARSFLQIIYDESERLNRLIGDILELSKIESKRSPLECSPVHVSSFIESLLEKLNNVAAKKEFHYTWISRMSCLWRQMKISFSRFS